MSKLDTYIHEAPDALARLMAEPPDMVAITAAIRARAPRKIWIAGTGTSLFAAEIAARVWEEALGIDTEAIGSLVLLEQIETLRLGRDTVVVAISQTGATNVLVAAVTRARARGALTIGCTAFADSPLAAAVEIVLDSRTGPENTPGKTKGFITTTAAVALVGLAAADPDGWRTVGAVLTERLRRAIDVSDAAVEGWVERLGGVDTLWVVGSGRLAPAALEGGLKVLEVAKLPVIGKELEEMMHGQFHAIGPGAGIVFLAGAAGGTVRPGDLRRVVEAVGVPIVAIAEPEVAAAHPDRAWDLVLDLAGVDGLSPLVAAIPLQLFAERLARHRGLDPDRPRYPALYALSGSKSIYARPAAQ
jgi:glucosamine--fructose-6-phosphate aminotransferase (isomerizing)